MKSSDWIIPVNDTTSEEAAKACKFVCPHLNCGFRFYTKRGMLAHAGRCEWSNECEVERLLECRGPTCGRQYKIRWKDCDQDEDTWEPRGNVHPEAIKEFETENNLYVQDWPFRCRICDLPCKSERGVKIHSSRMHGRNDKTASKDQCFNGSLVDKTVREQKIEEQQALHPVILCEHDALENVFKFTYLGTVFAADGQQLYDIRVRMGKAMTRCGRLGHLFDSPILGPWLKIRLYGRWLPQ